jgi:hypothetical protein
MSDRTQSSVRTGALVGDAAAPDATAPAEPTPPSGTQAIPTTGAQKAQTPAADAAPAAKQAGAAPAGKQAGAAPAGKPTGGPPGAPPVPPSTGAGPVIGSAGASTTNPAGDAPVAPTTRGRVGRSAGRGPRRARLQLRHIDTWSALKISLVLSIALFFIWMVAVGILYGVLSALGVFDTLNELFGQLGSASGADSGGGDVVTPGVVFGGAAVIGAINIVLMTALCTVGTFIYNLCSDLVGGLELTLSERD